MSILRAIKYYLGMYRIWLLYTVICICISTQAQSQPDNSKDHSIADIEIEHKERASLLYKLAKKFKKEQIADSTIFYYSQAIRKYADIDILTQAYSLERELDDYLEAVELNDQHIATSWFTKGYVHLKDGTIYDNELAVEYLNKAKNLYNLLEDTIGIIECNTYLGSIYWVEFDLNSSEKYFSTANSLAKEFSDFPKNKKLELSIWLVSNHLYNLMMNREVAKKEHAVVYNKYLSLIKSFDTFSIPDEHYYKALIFNDLGLHFWVLNRLDTIVNTKVAPSETLGEWKFRMLDSAKFYFNLAIPIWKRNFGKLHREIANTMNNLAMAYQGQAWLAENMLERNSINLVNITKNYYKKALHIRIKTQGAKHPDVARNINNLASLHESKREFDLALQYYNQASMASTFEVQNGDFKTLPQTDNINSEIQLLYSLKRKAFTFGLMYAKSNKLEHLKNSFGNYILAQNLIEKMVSRYREGSSVLNIIRRNWWIYENSIHQAIQLFNITNETRYLEQAVEIADRSKQNIIRSAIKKRSISSLTFEYDSIAQIDSLLYNNYYKTKRQYFVQLKRGDTTITSRENYITHKMAYERFLENIKQSRYYLVKYAVDSLNIEKLRKKWITKNDIALIEYFSGEDNIFYFLISKDSFKYAMLNKDSLYLSKITQFRESVSNKYFTSAWSESLQNFKNSGYFIYDKLLNELDSNILDHFRELIIIPDAELSYIPFSVLTTVSPEKDTSKNYDQLSYLFLNTKIRYAHSYFLFDKVNNQQTDQISFNNFLGFACSNGYDNKQAIPGAIASVQNGARLLNGKSYIDGSFNIENLFYPSPTPKVMEIAMHTQILDSNSGIATCNDSSFIQVSDFYDADYRGLDLLVFSGCDTGVGPYQRGEGISSFARAVNYAGAPSIIVSLWPLNDQISLELTKSLYQNLKAGNSKLDALNKAKIDLIKRYSLNEATRKYTHPYYWAGLTLYGENGKVNFTPNNAISPNVKNTLVFLYLIFLFIFIFLANKHL